MTEDKSDDFFDDLEKEAEATQERPTEKSLETVRSMGTEAVALQRRIERGEALLKELKSKRWNLLNKEMPAVMDELKVPYIAIDGYDLSAINYYKANIASDDPDEKREAAFAWLETAGGGDIVNNTVTVSFPMEEAEYAQEFAAEVAKKFHNHQGIIVAVKKGVPWNRLTTWLKDYVTTPPKRGEEKLAVPLDLLNATLGRIVKITEMKDD